MKSRRRQTILKYSIYVGIIVTVATSSVGFASYRFYNAKLIKERSNFQQQLLEEKEKLKIYESKNRVGWVLLTDKKAGETILEADVKKQELPDYFTPTNLVLKKEDVVGKTIKINALTSSAITVEMVYASGPLAADVRKEETEYIKLPLRAEKGQTTVDIRVVFPNGEDYVVISKKKLNDFDLDKQQAFFTDNEEEALMLQSALVDAYINNAELYMKAYVEPEMQAAPIANYLPNLDVISLLKSDPMIVDRAKWGLVDRLRKSLDDRLKEIEEAKKVRVGADAPQNSGVIKRKKPDGATAATPTDQQQKPVQGGVNSIANQSNNPTIQQPGTTNNSTKESTSKDKAAKNGAASSNSGQDTIFPSTVSEIPPNLAPADSSSTPNLLGGE
ncbi:hypothetical protein GCM10008018_58530 [Paenibacillus marchantiophytorum]|uniref:SAF domain-containing protein n=1 Tax=Paenibacillus marchantiophytorum TaxID=1619310 RepID=A0ABQ1FAU0_9BACL|nr:SAF domain-containing protein [Paenibacillus marchantiophytorum]GGA04934.1 hypothetical protein GCM10008018_58530 [Paenibacillus marchantiophytorum]